MQEHWIKVDANNLPEEKVIGAIFHSEELDEVVYGYLYTHNPKHRVSCEGHHRTIHHITHYQNV